MNLRHSTSIFGAKGALESLYIYFWCVLAHLEERNEKGSSAGRGKKDALILFPLFFRPNFYAFRAVRYDISGQDEMILSASFLYKYSKQKSVVKIKKYNKHHKLYATSFPFFVVQIVKLELRDNCIMADEKRKVVQEQPSKIATAEFLGTVAKWLSPSCQIFD
ncbi:hypothetical protein BX600DRAFT_84834 [Xylariales sp. PMI_506]|nr:hypothetical protein BX600DRAFT_84834 [Xylariales sp. PMI_506]